MTTQGYTDEQVLEHAAWQSIPTKTMILSLLADRQRLQAQLSDMKRLAKDAFYAWDDDMDSRVGKLLQAMLGPGYAASYRPDLPSLSVDNAKESGHDHDR